MPPKNVTIVVKTKTKKKTKGKFKKRNKSVVLARVRKAPRMKRSRHVSPPNNMAMQYMKCLADPFKFGPVRAGFDTLLPTQVHTAYTRGTLIASLDGTARFFLNPGIFAGVSSSISFVSNVPAWITGNYNNAAFLNAQADEYRVLAMGIRAFPRIAATSAPGMCFMNLVPKMDFNELATYANYSATSATTMPYTQIHLASSNTTDFYQNCWRPGDVSDFIFKGYDQPLILNTAGTITLNSLNTSTGGWKDTTTAFLDTIFTGLPVIAAAGTPVYYEVIVHYETTDSIEAINSETANDASPSVASEGTFSSLETMFRSMSNNLPGAASVVALGGSLLASPLVASAIKRHTQRLNGYVHVD